MKLPVKRYSFHKLLILFMLSVACLFTLPQGAFAQEHPPRPLVVRAVQNLAFGAFAHGALGGTVTVSAAGTRSATGDVILLNLGYPISAATFRIIGNNGTVVSILNGPDVVLPGSNGGSMTLHIGASSPASPFVLVTSPPSFTLMNVGATLTVGNTISNPPGNYSGSFLITFIQE